jgi:hypothetical protein
MTHDEAITLEYNVFALLHPVEAYFQCRERFCNYLRAKGHDITDEQVAYVINHPE